MVGKSIYRIKHGAKKSVACWQPKSLHAPLEYYLLLYNLKERFCNRIVHKRLFSCIFAFQQAKMFSKQQMKTYNKHCITFRWNIADSLVYHVTIKISTVLTMMNHGVEFPVISWNVQQVVVASCQFYRLVATSQQVATSLSISSSCNKPVRACCNLSFAD